jgi:hypothetical protein
MTIWCMRIACWIRKATSKDSQYLTLIAFPLQQRLRERASILPYTFIVRLVDNGDAVCLLIGRSCLCVLLGWIRSYVPEMLTVSCQHADKIVGWTAAVRACGRNRQRSVKRLESQPACHLVLHTESLPSHLHTLMASCFTEHGDGITFFCCLCSRADDALRGLNSELLCVSVVSNLLTH